MKTLLRLKDEGLKGCIGGESIPIGVELPGGHIIYFSDSKPGQKNGLLNAAAANPKITVINKP